MKKEDLKNLEVKRIMFNLKVIPDFNCIEKDDTGEIETYTAKVKDVGYQLGYLIGCNDGIKTVFAEVIHNLEKEGMSEDFISRVINMDKFSVDVIKIVGDGYRKNKRKE